MQHLQKSFGYEAVCCRCQVNGIIKNEIIRVKRGGVIPGGDGVFETILRGVLAHLLVHRCDIKEFDVSGASRMDQGFGRAIPVRDAGV